MRVVHYVLRLDNAREKDIFYAGQIDGLVRYASWKDGVQYVGSCGTTLKEALLELERDRYGADKPGSVLE